MPAMTKHVDEDHLRVLVFGEEGSDEYKRVAAHVESCETCQDRLDQITGLHEVQGKAAALLKKDPLSDPGHPDFDGPELFDPSEYLSPPIHPELLGRLGRYDIEKLIGSGGMGTVLKGYDSELNRPVAVKLLGRHLSHSGPAKQRFAREARAAAAVVHEHVVAIYDVQSSGIHPYLVMQYVPGDSLQARVDRNGPLTPAEILRIGMHAASGLAAAHEQGVIHRDIKPGNIMLEDGVDRALLTDFGLARTIDEASLTSSGIVAGTPHYMSPEQAGGDLVDHRTDLFSLGSVLYFMATGHPPFRAERTMGILNRICHHPHRPVWQINPNLPDSLAIIIDRLLEKKPARRYRTALEAKTDLAKALEQYQVGKGPGWTTRARRWVRNYQKPIAVGLLAIGLIAGAILGWNLLPPKPESTQVPDPLVSQTEPVAPAKELDPEVLREVFRPIDFTGEASKLDKEIERLGRDFQSPPSAPTEDPWHTTIHQTSRQLDQLKELILPRGGLPKGERR